jgi:hypothetical protein
MIDLLIGQWLSLLVMSFGSLPNLWSSGCLRCSASNEAFPASALLLEFASGD